MVARPTLFVCGLLAAALSSGACGKPVDLKQAVQVADASSGWFDAGVQNGKNKLVPSVTFKLKKNGKIKEKDKQHDFLILDPTSIIFDAAFQLRLHLDPAHPMSRMSPLPRVVNLLNTADTEQNSDARAAILREVQKIAYDEGLTIPLYQVVDLYAVRDRVTGFTASKDTILRLGGVGLQ